MEPYNSDDIKRKKRKKIHGLDRLLGVTAALIVSTEGLLIASALPQGIDEERIAAMTATLLSLSKMAIIEMRKGDFDQLYIKGSEGYLLVMQAGPNAVLAVSTTKDIRLGLVLLDCGRICENISRFLGGDFEDNDEDDDDDRFPYPLIFNSPEPPDDLEPAPQTQVHSPSKEKSPEDEIYCQYCGRKLNEKERFSHNCRKSPE